MNVDIQYKSLSLDKNNIDVRPGDWVVIKPNLVKECKESDESEWESVITSPALIDRVCEIVCEKLNGKGKISICDAPQTDSSFFKISERAGLYAIAKKYMARYQISIEVFDLRNEEWTNKKGIISERKKLSGDPQGSIAFNVGRASFFYGYRGEGKYYGADYDSAIVNKHHCGEKQEYLICATPVLCDVLINMPKLKTHKKTGVTLSLKNLVGINADKNWLPHHTEGDPSSGGDQFPELSFKKRLEQVAVRNVRRMALAIPLLGPKMAQYLRKAGTKTFGSGDEVIRSGNWYGNDTTWRMVLDLNRCLLYGNPDGTLRTSNPKRYYTVIDGIVGMEGNGPMQGEPVASDLVISGADPVATDMVAAKLMGFDWRKIPVIREAFKVQNYPITLSSPKEVYISSNNSEWCGLFSDIEKKNFLSFKPHFGWQGHIEYEK
ncbi:DUF362 domain-containing protein [Desulfohalobium retbaense]|uniref:DUF362 domain-containing protein n=1 Tax=Desulfohalobium retbaense (strain ATCC 49708 / DSM 5692 / JCM 16813 / HR100) TaxID=485915 RepID=C8X061_DESRD|nr:DUF362 domain-containing protein [Desulfohalobium retbaense]ACV67686.1 conserved hypothetical protein [Desulfohalobium retbaense DSM 5692]